MDLKLWQEVENKQGTISGLVYEILENSVKFRDEHGTNYYLDKKDVIPANYLSFNEKLEIAQGFKHFNFRRDKIH